jgi:hypothetical protein
MDEETEAIRAALSIPTAIWKLGIPLAMIVSWEQNHSILWAVLHGPCSFLYIGWHFWLAKVLGL